MVFESLSDFFDPADATPASFDGPMVLELARFSLNESFVFSLSANCLLRSFGKITRGTEALLEFFRCCHHRPLGFDEADSAVFKDELIKSSSSS